MLLLGHIGITTGIVRACEILVSSAGSQDIRQHDSASGFSAAGHKERLQPHRLLNSIRSRMGSIDYRLVVIGSLLPDILDKPLFLFGPGELFPSGHAYGHTFLFNLLLLVCGSILFRYKKPWLLVISLSSCIHLVLDRIWNNPVTLWWPLLGPFAKGETAGWISDKIHVLTSNPSAYIPEIIGATVILLLGYRLLTRKNITNFIKTGALS